MFWRVQESGHSIQGHTSSDWGYSEAEKLDEGCICACSSARDLGRLIHEWYSTCPEYLTGQEVVVFSGESVRDLGDGWLVNPTGEGERMSVEQFISEYMDGEL